MNLLDLILIVIAIGYGLAGYLQGFLVNLVSTIGLVIGGLLAIGLMPVVMGDHRPSAKSSVIALLIVVLVAAVGQAIGTYVGHDLRRGLSGRTMRSLDALAGGALSVVTVLVATWALGYAVSGSGIPVLSSQVRSSTVLSSVDGVMPKQANGVLSAFNRVLDANLFPRYMDPFEPEEITSVGPPDPGSSHTAGVRKASASVVKIVGSANCQRGLEGSGFVYAPNRIMTNAHVVAGVSEPVVYTGNQRMRARVVLFDPQTDIAVLATRGLHLPALSFDKSGRPGDDAAVLGYPENGPFDVQSARIRSKQNLRSPDIYDRGQVTRSTWSLRALVRSGNSGGPVVSLEGRVYGVIFAGSVSDSQTGYALTAEQVADDAERGRQATTPVSTGSCA